MAKDSPRGVYYVRIWLDDRDNGNLCGPFGSRDAAERFAVSAITRQNVLRIEITKEDND